MSNIQTGAERMPHDLSHLGFLAGQIGRLITISTTPVIAGDSFEMDAVGADRKSGSAGMPRPISYAVFCLQKKKCLHYINLITYMHHAIVCDFSADELATEICSFSLHDALPI